MSQIQSDQSQTTRSATPPAPDDDPLSHLHKMSTTAGLGSGDYVAVNGGAVFALLLGLGSALALLDELLLIIPLTGIIIAIVALRQIHQSNGTQTGRWLVALGVVLMLGFGGYVFAQDISNRINTRDDRRAITAMITQLGENVKAGKYDEAYKAFSSRFGQIFPPDKFKERIVFLNEAAVYGKLKGMSTGPYMQFQTDESTGAKFAVVRVLIDFEKTERPLPDDLTMHKEQDQWLIEAFPSLFQPPRQGQGPGQ